MKVNELKNLRKSESPEVEENVEESQEKLIGEVQNEEINKIEVK